MTLGEELGESYREGDVEAALVTYDELNPRNQNAKDMLKILEDGE